LELLSTERRVLIFPASEDGLLKELKRTAKEIGKTWTPSTWRQLRRPEASLS